MSDSLKSEILAAIAAAPDEAALENVRVAALGKKGSVSELLKTLGGLSPEERKEKGPAFNALRDEVNAQGVRVMAPSTVTSSAAGFCSSLSQDTVGSSAASSAVAQTSASVYPPSSVRLSRRDSANRNGLCDTTATLPGTRRDSPRS